MNYGAGKDICICHRTLDGLLSDDPRPYWLAMPKMRPTRYPDMDDCWILEEDFYLRIGELIYCIQKGFDFDGASIPKAVWSIIGHPMEMWILLAALPHDAWYASNQIPRLDADWLFLEIIQACDRATPIDASWFASRLFQEEARWSRRNKCWSAVRLAGGAVYPKSFEELQKYKAFVSIIALASNPEK
jgi:hypothetical protein